MSVTGVTSADFAGQTLVGGAAALGLGSLTDARLLVIDDSSFARKTINAMLANHGFTNIKLAIDGGEGIALAVEWSPDIIITDLYMPVKSGFDLCRELRSQRAFRETPIIVQTSADTPSVRGDVFEAGASDLITKPINARELLSRIRVHLERMRLIESLKDFRRQMQEELNSAKAMQMELLPANQLIGELEQLFPVKFAWHSQPCQDLGGDIWGLNQLDDRRIRLWNADFTGHGVKSALNTFRLNTFLRTSLRNDQSGPAHWLKSVNSFLCEVLPTGQFATMLCCDIDFDRGKVAIASAGAPEPVVQIGGVNRVVEIGGMPLGISDTIDYEQQELEFGPGCCLFACSDALIETPSADEALFDAGRLARRLDELQNLPVAKRPLRLLQDLIGVAPNGLDDDLTMIFLQHEGSGSICSSAQDEIGEADANAEGSDGTALGQPADGCEEFVLRTISEAADLTAKLAGKYPKPEMVSTGIWELLINAIEHGNLGISHAEKTRLLLDDRLDAEIERRLNLADLKQRRVHVEFKKTPFRIHLTIRDEGTGFDYEKYINGELRLDVPNGRGIAIAQTLSFDRLVYHGCGNLVEAILNLDQ